jgi:2-(1,2-epoxy-1,2-dihydrophenyl)acetyl-CoA isomerase
MPSDYQHILVETTPDGVRTLTLNRPERLNAVNVVLADELPRAVAEAGADDAVRVLVITGAGRAFCAGLDLDPANLGAWLNDQGATRAARLDDLEWVGRWALALVECPKPVIAALNGVATGAGLGLALAADIRLISAAATLNTGYARRGLSPDAGVSYFLPRLVGLSRAADLVFTARDVAAEEAERIGLVSRVLPAEDFAAQVADYAAGLAAGPPLALTLSKRLLASSTDTALVPQLKRELSAIRTCFTTDDLQEALHAFAEKRPPRFTGR